MNARPRGLPFRRANPGFVTVSSSVLSPRLGGPWSEELLLRTFDPTELVVVDLDPDDVTIRSQGLGLRLDLLSGKHAADWGEITDSIEEVEVASELFDTIDLPAA